MKKDKIAREISQKIIEVLKKKNNEGVLPLVIDYLKKYSLSDIAFVYTPRKLTRNEYKRIEKLILKLAGIKPEKISVTIDEDLIDGLKISYKDKIWDMTTLAQLLKLSK